MRGRAEGATAFGPSMAGASLPKCNFNGAYEKSKSESTPWLPPLLLLLLLLSVSRAAFVVVYVSSGQRRQFARGQFSSFDSCLQCCACVRARVCVSEQMGSRHNGSRKCQVVGATCTQIRLASG